MRWTGWRLLADGRYCFDDVCDWDGPSCYELGTGGPRGGNIQIHYVGETCNERSRMQSYARSGSHLARTIDEHLRRGWRLYYRSVTCDSKESAEALQNRLLRRYEYDWNLLLNR